MFKILVLIAVSSLSYAHVFKGIQIICHLFKDFQLLISSLTGFNFLSLKFKPVLRFFRIYEIERWQQNTNRRSGHI
jgi:ABC-type Na+ efflux pump permease subunit